MNGKKCVIGCKLILPHSLTSTSLQPEGLHMAPPRKRKKVQIENYMVHSTVTVIVSHSNERVTGHMHTNVFLIVCYVE